MRFFMIFLILGILLGGFAVVFALQNTATVTVSFLSWQLEGSLALILLIAMATGALVALLIVLPSLIKDIFILRSVRKQKKRSEAELSALKETTPSSPVVPPTDTAL